MRDLYKILRRDKKILTIGVLLLYICYNIVSSQQCSTSYVHNENSPEYDLSEYAVLIASAPSNYARRDSIRKTWFKFAGEENKQLGTEQSGKIRFFFIAGTGGLDEFDIRKLKREHNSYHDMLLFDAFVDNYKALTPKMLLTYKWISRNMKNLKYVIKCDDDSFLRIDLIVHNLMLYAPEMGDHVISKFVSQQKHPRYKGLYWGYFNGKAGVFKSGKWEERNWFLCDRYLPYALGGAYVISRNIVDFIARNADDLSLYNSEDVSMGVWTSTLDGINRVHDLRFDTSATSRGCSNDMLVKHKISVSEMFIIYKLLENSNGKILCKDENVKNFYIYNWTASPSMCCKTNVK